MTGSHIPSNEFRESADPGHGTDTKSTDLPVLNREKLHLVFGDDTDFLHKFLNSFLEICPGYMDEIREAAEAADEERLTASAHRLHSSLESLQADAACKVAAHLETIARAGDLEAVPAVMDELEAEIERLKEILSEEMAS